MRHNTRSSGGPDIATTSCRTLEYMFYCRAMGTRGRVYTPPEPAPDPRRRLCWVRVAPGATECPGVILEWRMVNGSSWAARVVYVPDPMKVKAVEDWFAREWVRVLDVSPQRSGAGAIARYRAAGGTRH